MHLHLKTSHYILYFSVMVTKNTLALLFTSIIENKDNITDNKSDVTRDCYNY